MSIAELLDRPIAYHRVFVTLTGSVKAAIMLSQAIYWQKRAKQADGFWYKTTEEWQDETGLTRHEQDTARTACEKYLKTDLRDVPARLYWHVDEDALSADLIALSSQASLTESGKLGERKAANINRSAETTTETTALGGLSETEHEQANRKVTAVIESARKKSYQNRDKIPEPYLEYCDAYVQLTGQEPRKAVLQDWLMSFSEWKSAGVLVKHIRGAYEDANKPGGFLPTRPGSLTNKAIALQGRDKAAVETRSPVFRAADHPEPAYVPPPPGLMDRFKQTIASKEVKA